MESELIALTDEAKKRILSAFEQQPDKVALRVEANVSGTSEFSYENIATGEGYGPSTYSDISMGKYPPSDDHCLGVN